MVSNEQMIMGFTIGGVVMWFLKDFIDDLDGDVWEDDNDNDPTTAGNIVGSEAWNGTCPRCSRNKKKTTKRCRCVKYGWKTVKCKFCPTLLGAKGCKETC